MRTVEDSKVGHVGFEDYDLRTIGIRDLARTLGDRVRCPVTDRLIEKRTPELMAPRYAEILYYYGFIVEETAKVSPEVASQIKERRRRLPGENLVDYDKRSVTEDDFWWVYGTETMLGYAGPRLIIDYINQGILEENTPEENLEATIERSGTVLNYFKDALTHLESGDNDISLLLRFAEKIASEPGQDVVSILRRTLSPGKLFQDSFYTYYEEAFRQMDDLAKTLSDKYFSLTTQQLTDLDLPII